jgi:phage/plasmid-associated DNA primase
MTFTTNTVQSDLQSKLSPYRTPKFKATLLNQLATIPANYQLVPICACWVDDKGNLRGAKTPKGDNWGTRPIPRSEIEEAICNGTSWGFGLKLGVNGGGILAIDVDGTEPKNGLESILSGQPLPNTVKFTSGKPDRCQYLFSVPQEQWSGLEQAKAKFGNADLDFRWGHNKIQPDGTEKMTSFQSCLPATFHSLEYGVYNWVEGSSPDDTEIAQLPDVLMAYWLELINPVKAERTNTRKPKPSTTPSLPSGKNKDFKRRLASAVTKVANCTEGGRNALLNNKAHTLAGLFPDKVGVIRAALTDAAITCGLGLSEIEATLNSAISAGIKKPITAYGSSGGSDKPQPRVYAQMLQSSAMKHVEYCTVTDTFMAYSEKAGLWEQVADKKGEAMVNRALSELGVFSLRFTMDVWAFIKLDAIAKESSFLPLDRSKIAFQNGVLDLETMILAPNSPELKVTSRLEYCYPDVGSDFPVTRKFISDIACGDKELQGFFIHWLAATLRRMSGCRKFLNLYGHTTNGKSTYLKLIATMIGQSNVFSTSLAKLGGHFGASGADGKWAIQCTDDRGGYGIDYGNLLKFSGDDNNVPMVKKGKDQKGVVDFQGLVMLATNINLFAGQIGDAAIKTRMISVHCQASFTEDQQDEHLLEKMTAELPQLVHYLLNINPTEVSYGLRHSGDISVIKAHNLEQILDGEMVADFWDKVCVVSTGETQKLSGLLVYNAYCHYYSELHNGTKPNLSAKKFYPALERYALTLSGVTLTKDLKNKRALTYTNFSLVDFSHLGMNSMARG